MNISIPAYFIQSIFQLKEENLNQRNKLILFDEIAESLHENQYDLLIYAKNELKLNNLSVVSQDEFINQKMLEKGLTRILEKSDDISYQQYMMTIIQYGMSPDIAFTEEEFEEVRQDNKKLKTYFNLQHLLWSYEKYKAWNEENLVDEFPTVPQVHFSLKQFVFNEFKKLKSFNDYLTFAKKAQIPKESQLNQDEFKRIKLIINNQNNPLKQYDYIELNENKIHFLDVNEKLQYNQYLSKTNYLPFFPISKEDFLNDKDIIVSSVNGKLQNKFLKEIKEVNNNQKSIENNTVFMSIIPHVYEDIIKLTLNAYNPVNYTNLELEFKKETLKEKGDNFFVPDKPVMVILTPKVFNNMEYSLRQFLQTKGKKDVDILNEALDENIFMTIHLDKKDASFEVACMDFYQMVFKELLDMEDVEKEILIHPQIIRTLAKENFPFNGMLYSKDGKGFSFVYPSQNDNNKLMSVDICDRYWPEHYGKDSFLLCNSFFLKNRDEGLDIKIFNLSNLNIHQTPQGYPVL